MKKRRKVKPLILAVNDEVFRLLDKEYISIEEKISLFNNSKRSNKKFLCLNTEIKEILNNNSLIYIKVEDKNGKEIFTERYKKDSCNFI